MVALRRDDDDIRTRRAPGAAPVLRAVLPAGDTTQRVRADALPEHTDYRDTGCDVSPNCLQCPLARCKYDEPGGVRRLVTEARDREIVLLRRRHAAPISMLAGAYGLSRRSIFRILREHDQREGRNPCPTR